VAACLGDLGRAGGAFGELAAAMNKDESNTGKLLAKMQAGAGPAAGS
jgi:hypothetical protein